MIDPNKEYQTRDGRPVRIYATDGSYPRPVHGAIWARGWRFAQWTRDGHAKCAADMLVEKPTAREVWIVWYSTGGMRVVNHPPYPGPNVVAVKHTKITVGEGVERSEG